MASYCKLAKRIFHPLWDRIKISLQKVQCTKLKNKKDLQRFLPIIEDVLFLDDHRIILKINKTKLYDKEELPENNAGIDYHFTINSHLKDIEPNRSS